MKIKWYVYIQVWNGEKWQYVTDIDHASRQAWWSADGKPLRFTLSVAKDIAWALSVNGYNANVVQSLRFIDKQM